jgi:hypothetical protein
MTAPTWKLKIRQISRWQDLRSMLGWRWEWEVRKWWETDSLASGYYAADLIGWHGRARTEDSARRQVQGARDYFAAEVRRQENEWESWYVD